MMLWPQTPPPHLQVSMCTRERGEETDVDWLFSSEKGAKQPHMVSHKFSCYYNEVTLDDSLWFREAVSNADIDYCLEKHRNIIRL